MTPVSESRWVVTVRLANDVETSYSIDDEGPYILGRNSSCTIRIDDEHASQVHARLRHVRGRWLLDDLGSTNGTAVNGHPIVRCQLRYSDTIEIGGARIFLTNLGAPRAEASTPLFRRPYNPAVRAPEASRLAPQDYSEDINRVFLSYRREDSATISHAVASALKARFGPDRVFLDVLDIELGADFEKVIRTAISKCSVLLAIVGKSWRAPSGGQDWTLRGDRAGLSPWHSGHSRLGRWGRRSFGGGTSPGDPSAGARPGRRGTGPPRA